MEISTKANCGEMHSPTSKRMYVVTCIASGLVNLWVIYGKGNGQWIICRLLVGLCISPQFALVEISTRDRP
jgi:hypothetical protein